MLKKTTFKLSLSLLGSSLISAVLSLLIILLVGGIGAKSPSNRSVKSIASSAQSMSSTQSVAGTSSVRSNTGVSKTTSVEKASNVSAVSASSETGNTSSFGSSSVSKKKAKTSSASYNFVSTGGLISYPAGRFIVGLLCMLIFVSLIYNTAWQEGNKDPNRVKYGHTKKFMPKGLVAGLLTIIPYAILTTVFLATNANNAKATAEVIINIMFRVLNIQYIVFSDAYISLPIACYLLLLVLPIISGLGYLAGYSNFTMITKLLYKNQKRPDGTYSKRISNLKK